MIHSRILGTGSYLPEKRLTNRDLEKMVDTDHQWIVERTGIVNRHIAAKSDTTSSMAAQAARHAIEMAGIDKNDIGMVISATTTPDRLFPSSGCILQGLLDIGDCPAFDVGAACGGFIYSLSIADQFIRNGTIKYALVTGSEVMSRIVDWTDRKTCILFGDGAGAVILGASETPGIIATHIHANGRYKDLLYAENHLNNQKQPDDNLFIQMRGNEVFRVGVRTLSKIVDETLEKNHISKADIDWLIPHQANLRMIKATAEQLDLPMERVILTVQEHGNTSAASIPLALDIGVRDGRVKKDELLLLEAFGGGFTWGSALIRF